MRIEVFDEHRARAGVQCGAEHGVEAEYVKQRQYAQHHVVGAGRGGPATMGTHLFDVDQQIAVREHRGTRRTGGAAGEDRNRDRRAVDVGDGFDLVAVERIEHRSVE